MASSRLDRQSDLFDAAPGALAQEPPPEDFIQRIRDELNRTLARAREAETLPWPDLTKAYLAELRFRSVAHWLPTKEADALRTAFNAEMDRLYAAYEAAHAIT